MRTKVAFEKNPVLEQSVEHSREDRMVPGSYPHSETLEDRIVLGSNPFKPKYFFYIILITIMKTERLKLPPDNDNADALASTAFGYDDLGNADDGVPRLVES